MVRLTHDKVFILPKSSAERGGPAVKMWVLLKLLGLLIVTESSLVSSGVCTVLASNVL